MFIFKTKDANATKILLLHNCNLTLATENLHFLLLLYIKLKLKNNACGVIRKLITEHGVIILDGSVLTRLLLNARPGLKSQFGNSFF